MTVAQANLIRETIEYCELTIRFVQAHAQDDNRERLQHVVALIANSRTLLEAYAREVGIH